MSAKKHALALVKPQVTSAQSSIECHCDGISSLDLHGWAVDRGDPSRPALLHLLVDGQEIGQVVCSDLRPDVQAAGLAPEVVGYRFKLPSHLADDCPHRLEIRDRFRREVAIILDGRSVTNVDFTVTFTPRVASLVDGLRDGAIEGWVLRTNRDDPAFHGNCVVHVTCDGVTAGHVRANRHRGDVATTMAASPVCGFQFFPPAHLRSNKPRTFRFFLVPDGVELAGSPFVTSLMDDVAEARILELSSSIDNLHRELTRIRTQIRALISVPGHTVAGYDRWFRLYQPALRRRMQAQRPVDNWASGPLVSIVCPVYRPLLGDFRSAVESVLVQSYPNWELILVDDGSRDPALAALLTEMAANDKRIRVVVLKKNKGISEATNAALHEAKGEWVAFFDHDDALVDTAIECMVAEAQRTGARMLYSDEDKVDGGGNYLAPAFKPDWNHRLLLGMNYVCHLLLVQKSLLDETGPLSTRHNGAQDHDLVLRLSERLAPTEIHHVPEVLYHWRITIGSTAGSESNKSYAIAAGMLAVSEHLDRLGRPAVITSVEGKTVYKATWQIAHEPSVTIIIPFRDQIATTERCLNAVLKLTDYKNYDIILLDNWSTAPELARLQRVISKIKKVRMIRIDEEFNYSRFNNLATAETDAEYYMFMNNDLFVTEAGWLRVLVNEAIVDPSVGAVGGKFYYPDGTIQHAGVVTGIGGVAAHVHVGLRAGEPGYCVRALFAQELSAVTGAGMLVRSNAFHQVGGFDAEKLPVAFNDIDLCLKLRQSGYKVIWTPDFVAEHHESLSRGADDRPDKEARFFDEVEVMKERWGETLTHDPFYSPKFALDRPSFFDLIDPA